VLIYLTCLKCLRVLKGIIKKNFYFSNLILLAYSLLPFKAYFITYVAWRVSSSTLLTILIRFKLRSFLDFLNSWAYKVSFSKPAIAN